MIEVRNLTKDYGPHRAINNLNFLIKKGEVVGFLGPNGAGKSTTMKIITGFMAPTSGEALVGGYDVFEEPIKVKKQIGYLPEIPPLYTDMYVKDYLQYVAKLKGVSKENLKSYVDLAIEKTNLEEVYKRIIQNLSKGFKQRVGIAQAIVSNPEILILDEPTSGLDPKQVAEIRRLIQDLKGHHTIILSTHVLSEVQVTCERFVIINKGKIVAQNNLSGLSDMIRSGQVIINLKIARPNDSLIEKLISIPGIKKVLPQANLNNEFKIEADLDNAVPEKIAEEVVRGGFGLIELQSDKINLEDVFLKLTYDADMAKE